MMTKCFWYKYRILNQIEKQKYIVQILHLDNVVVGQFSFNKI